MPRRGRARGRRSFRGFGVHPGMSPAELEALRGLDPGTVRGEPAAALSAAARRRRAREQSRELGTLLGGEALEGLRQVLAALPAETAHDLRALVGERDAGAPGRRRDRPRGARTRGRPPAGSAATRARLIDPDGVADLADAERWMPRPAPRACATVPGHRRPSAGRPRPAPQRPALHGPGAPRPNSPGAEATVGLVVAAGAALAVHPLAAGVSVAVRSVVAPATFSRARRARSALLAGPGRGRADARARRRWHPGLRRRCRLRPDRSYDQFTPIDMCSKCMSYCMYMHSDMYRAAILQHHSLQTSKGLLMKT